MVALSLLKKIGVWSYLLKAWLNFSTNYLHLTMGLRGCYSIWVAASCIPNGFVWKQVPKNPQPQVNYHVPCNKYPNLEVRPSFRYTYIVIDFGFKKLFLMMVAKSPYSQLVMYIYIYTYTHTHIYIYIYINQS